MVVFSRLSLAMITFVKGYRKRLHINMCILLHAVGISRYIHKAIDQIQNTLGDFQIQRIAQRWSNRFEIRRVLGKCGANILLSL